MPISPAEFAFVRDLVHQRSAIVLEPGKEYLVESRLTTVARGEGFQSLEQFLGELRLRPNGGLTKRVVEAMTTNETSWFRDVHPFDAFRTVLLPEVAQRNAASRQVNIWCAAASTGQEPYTLAMLCREAGPLLAGWTVRIVATDLSTEVLERAREGRYSQLEVNRGLPAPFLVKYFRKVGAEWQLVEDVRKMVDYRTMNLAEPWPSMGPFDVVFMRNVLIYFDVPTKKEILARTRKVLRSGAPLVLGGAETTLNLDDAYRREQVGRAVCYRTP